MSKDLLWPPRGHLGLGWRQSSYRYGRQRRVRQVVGARSGKCERTVTGHRGPVTCVGLSDSRMASGSEDNEIRVYSFGSSPGPGPTIEVGTPN